MSDGAVMMVLVLAIAGIGVLGIAWKIHGWKLIWYFFAAPVWIALQLLKGTAWGAGRAFMGAGRSRVKDPATAEIVPRKIAIPARTPKLRELGHGYHYTPGGLAKGVHKVTIGEAGSAKGQTCVNYEIQFQLQHSPENLILLEVKPNLELSNIVYAYARPQDRIWEYTMQPKDGDSSAIAITEPGRVRDLARSLTHEPEAKDAHWNSKAEELIPALTSGGRTISDVRDVVVDRRRLEQARETEPAVDNVADENKEWGYIRSTASRHLQPLADTRVRRVMAGAEDTPQPTFAGYPPPAEGEPPGRDIVILRPHEASAEREARFVIAALDAKLKTAADAGYDPRSPGTKAILDEFASFLDLSRMRRYLDLGRGGRVQISYVLQGRDQLAAQVGKTKADSIIASTEIKAIGATSDYELAEMVAKLSRKQTVEYRGARETMRGTRRVEKSEARYVVEPSEITGADGPGKWTLIQGLGA